MNISAISVQEVYELCVQEVKKRIKDEPALSGKHAFHDSAQLSVSLPGTFENPVRYSGEEFSHNEKNNLFVLETEHYNKLILPTNIGDVVECLKQNSETKKAYLSFWNNDYIFGTSGEVPCLAGIHFYITNGCLNAVVQMRSNEVCHLLPVDICFGIALQTYVAGQLKLSIGQYTHQVASLILYAQDVPELNSL